MILPLRIGRPGSGAALAALAFARADRAGSPEVAERWLHPDERAAYSALPGPRRRSEFLSGRVAAKAAAGLLLRERDPARTLIRPGAFGQPFLDGPGCGAPPTLSLTHSGGLAAAAAFPAGTPVGIDIERGDGREGPLIAGQLTEAEKSLAGDWDGPRESFLALLWTSKEALAKALLGGLSIPLPLLEIRRIRRAGEGHRLDFVHFPHFGSLGWCRGVRALSLVLPATMEADAPKGIVADQLLDAGSGHPEESLRT